MTTAAQPDCRCQCHRTDQKCGVRPCCDKAGTRPGETNVLTDMLVVAGDVANGTLGVAGDLAEATGDVIGAVLSGIGDACS